jgi:hypothetical protein
MSVDVWLKRDIANALTAAYQAARETSCGVGGADPARAASFHAGYRSALSTVALFFGIAPGLVIPDHSIRGQVPDRGCAGQGSDRGCAGPSSDHGAPLLAPEDDDPFRMAGVRRLKR